ncbi:MAG: substrate-binding domain-containing protein [Clostridia bacterium]|nr:substrate-binding domain-containing protein [Clostridia bacterium]
MKRLLCALMLLCLLPLFALAEGSLVQINQPLDKPEGWQKIVENSPYALGDMTPYEDAGFSICCFGNYPSIDGSTVSVPLGMELARQLLNLPEEDLNGFVNFSTTPYAYERLILGKPNLTAMLPSQNAMMDQAQPVNLILVTEPSDEELEMAKNAGVELEVVPFCYDAFVFLVNGENDVDGLTMEEIRSIYSGQTYSWDQVGSTSFDPIIAYQRPKNSGSQTAMENMVMKGLRFVAVEENYVSDGMSDLVQQIGDYSNSRQSLGYSFLYYLNNLYVNENIKVLAVDGVYPSTENLQNGTYPLTANYYAVYLKGDTEAEAFVQWLLSDEGQKCVEQAGYIPIGN